MPFNLILIGIISLLGQVTILRELSVAFYGIELIYILAIAFWLFWTGIGAKIAHRSFHPTPQIIVILFFALGFILPLDVIFIRGMRHIFGGTPGAYLPFINQVIAINIALLPVCIILGLAFQWTARLYVKRGKTLARAYAIECFGGIIGGLAATILLKIGVQNLSILSICIIASFSSILMFHSGRINPYLRLLPILPIILIVFFSSKLSAIDYLMSGWNHPGLLDSRDTPYGRVTLRSQLGQLTVFENDALCFDSEGTASEEFACLSALQSDDPKEILLLGGGVEGLVYELLKHDPHRIDYVELNRRMLEMVVEHLPVNIKESLNADEVDIIINDPRRFLQTAGKYDLIMAASPEPMSGQNNRFYTKEFFNECSSHLKSDGILTFRLRSAENLWTPQLTKRNASIYQALCDVFPHVTVLPGVTNIFIASSESLNDDPDTLAGRLLARQIENRLVTPEYIRYLYTNDRFNKIREALNSENVIINSDNHPICYQYALMIWLSKFYNRIAFQDIISLTKDRQVIVIVFIVCLILLFAMFMFIRQKIALRLTFLVGMAALIGMVLETVLILNYQTRCGVLFQDIGLLLTAFMVGLTIGAWMTDQIIHKMASGSIYWFGIAVMSGLVLLNIVTAILLNLKAVSGMFSAGLLLILTGIFVAAVFAWASRQNIVDQSTMISRLYSADLIGGSVGGLGAALILAPALGQISAVIFTAVLSMLCLLLVRINR
jgi:spermidine synthase